MNKRCLILGGGGFIGSHLVLELLNLGYDVRIFERTSFNNPNLNQISNRVEVFNGDFSNIDDLRGSMENIDFIFHLISTTIPSSSILNPEFDIKSNLISTINLLQLCIEYKIKKLVFISSGGTVYGVPKEIPITENHNCNPINSYGIIKRAIESYILFYSSFCGLNACIFRLSNPYGELQNPNNKQGAITVFLNKVLKGEFIEIWGDGEVIRDYIYINDVTEILIKSIITETPEIIYNLGCGVGYSLNYILGCIEKITNIKPLIKYSEKRKIDVSVNILDNSLLIQRFEKNKFTDVYEGIQKLHIHMLSQSV